MNRVSSINMNLNLTLHNVEYIITHERFQLVSKFAYWVAALYVSSNILETISYEACC